MVEIYAWSTIWYFLTTVDQDSLGCGPHAAVNEKMGRRVWHAKIGELKV